MKKQEVLEYFLHKNAVFISKTHIFPPGCGPETQTRAVVMTNVLPLMHLLTTIRSFLQILMHL